MSILQLLTSRTGLTVAPPPVIEEAAFGNSAVFSASVSGATLSTTSTTDLVNWRSENGFTVEYWLCPMRFNSGQNAAPGIGNFNDAGTVWWAFGANNGLLDFYFFDGNLKNFRSAAGAIPLNTWTHIAASFTTVGTTTTGEFYINGVRQSMTLTGGVASETPTYTSASTPYNTSIPTRFGYMSSGNQYYGYVDNIRISSTNRYTGTSFTVPSGPFSDDVNTQLLLVLDEADGSTTFTDESSFARTITNPSNLVSASDYRANHSIPTTVSDVYADDVVMCIVIDEPTNLTYDISSYNHNLTSRRGPPTITDSDDPFGTTSKIMRFNSDSIDFPVTAVLQNFDTYTIEFWMKASATQTTYSTITGSSTNNSAIYIGVAAIDGYTLHYAFGAAPAIVVLTSPTALNDNVWRHIACVKDGSTAYAFIDGILVDTETGISSAYDTVYMSDGQLGGSRYSSGTFTDNYFTGDILDYRITKGVARYTSNFTPPTAPILNP